jgi:hypothetical protein
MHAPAPSADDYLAYQLATVPAHITGWLSISLTTSSLLKAVGINAGAAHHITGWLLHNMLQHVMLRASHQQ